MKMRIKQELRNVRRDLDYYMKNYELTQKEAYEYIHSAYYIKMMLTKDYVEIEVRNLLYNQIKEDLNIKAKEKEQ